MVGCWLVDGWLMVGDVLFTNSFFERDSDWTYPNLGKTGSQQPNGQFGPAAICDCEGLFVGLVTGDVPMLLVRCCQCWWITIGDR